MGSKMEVLLCCYLFCTVACFLGVQMELQLTSLTSTVKKSDDCFLSPSRSHGSRKRVHRCQWKWLIRLMRLDFLCFFALSLILTFLCLCLAAFQLPLSLISQSACRGTRRHSDVGGVQAAFATCPPLEPSESSTLRKSECDRLVSYQEKFK